MGFLASALLLGGVLAAWGAEPRRFGLMVGNAEGRPGMPLLYFAESDAEKMASVLTSVGGYERRDVRVILGGNRGEVMRALVEVRKDVETAKAAGQDTIFLFFYAGHADGERLQLGRSWLTWDELERLLELTGAEVRLAFLDACQSGSMTRARGGTLQEGFVADLTERLGVSGQVIVSSSSSDEASQESAEIGGGFFTHFLVSGLSGAADRDADERVSLSELYRYVYNETVFRTSSTRGGTQHPTYDYELAGKGDVILADLSQVGSSLVLSPSVEGPLLVFDLERRRFLVELDLDGEGAEIALRAGEYLVQRRRPSHLEVARVRVAESASTVLQPEDFRPVAYQDDLARGAILEQVRRMELPRLSLRILGGRRGFSNGAVSRSYIPQSPAGGASLRFNWRNGRWAAADVLSGAQVTQLGFEDLDYTVPIFSSSTTAGVGAGFATRPALLQAGFGGRLAAAWFRRDFLDGTLPAQDLFTVSPGLLVFAGIHPGRWEFEVEYHLQVLPYDLDEGLDNLLFSEALLAIGARF